jgi:hypothetical protein
MISSLRNFSVRILDADLFTIVVFQILDIKSNYLPGIVQNKLLAGGCWLLAVVFGFVGCWVVRVGFWVLAFGFWQLDFGCWLLPFDCRLLAISCWQLYVSS